MGDYELDNKITGIKQLSLPGFDRESGGDKRLVLKRTVTDFWETDTFGVATQIRKSFITGYSDDEHSLLQGAWNWVKQGGLLKVDGNVKPDVPLPVLLNKLTVIFWTGMREEFRDPGLSDFPVACEVGTELWKIDVRDICGECMYNWRRIAAGEIHKTFPSIFQQRIDTITTIEQARGQFRDLTNENIMRAEQVDSVTSVLLFEYYMTIVSRGKQLFEIYKRT